MVPPHVTDHRCGVMDQHSGDHQEEPCGEGGVGCKQCDLVSRQGKKYRRFKRAVIADMDE